MTDEEKAERQRDLYLQRTYGITSAEYDEILLAQDGHCAICPKRPTSKRRLAVDHDHRTGVVRGLLCHTCNYKLLGRRDGNPRIFLNAYWYLTSPPAIAVVGERRALS